MARTLPWSTEYQRNMHNKKATAQPESPAKISQSNKRKAEHMDNSNLIEVNLGDVTYSNLLDIIKKHGSTAEVKEAVHRAITSIELDWGAHPAKRTKEDLISSAHLAVHEEGETYIYGITPDALNQLVRYQVAGAVGKLLLSQKWTATSREGRMRTDHFAVEEHELKSLALIRRGMDAIVQAVRSSADLTLATKEHEEEDGENGEMVDENSNEQTEQEEQEKDTAVEDDAEETFKTLAFTPINSPRQGDPQKRQKTESSMTALSPTSSRDSPLSASTTTQGISSSSPAPKRTKTKPDATNKKTDDGETKTRKQQGCGKRWQPEESLYAVTSWWKDNLESDESKRRYADGSEIGTLERARIHNEWLATQGEDTTKKRTWDGMEQRIKQLKKDGKTAQVLRAEIAAKAVRARSTAGEPGARKRKLTTAPKDASYASADAES